MFIYLNYHRLQRKELNHEESKSVMQMGQRHPGAHQEREKKKADERDSNTGGLKETYSPI